MICFYLYYHNLLLQPLAIVSWGCVYRMSWVNDPEAKLWIVEHALKAEQSSVASDGLFEEGNNCRVDDFLNYWLSILSCTWLPGFCYHNNSPLEVLRRIL